MLNDIYHFLWSIPFFVFLFCVYLNYRWNLFNKCQVLYKAYHGWESRKRSSRNTMISCFWTNLQQSAGQNNLYFISACLLLGGAGSLFWMVIWAPVCIFLRFVQTLILWEDSDAPIGTSSCFTRILGERMHFPTAPYLGKLYNLLIWAMGICGLHIWGLANWVIPFKPTQNPIQLANWQAIPFLPVFLVLAVPVCLLAMPGSEMRETAIKRCRIIYGALLLILVASQYRLVLVALEVIVGDGFQLGNSISHLVGKGQLQTVAVGAALACFLSGLPWDEGVKRYGEAGREAGISPVTAGLWAMHEATLELFLLGGGAGLFLVMMDLARVSSVPETVGFLINGGWGVAYALSVFLLCASSACLGWNRWLQQLKQVKTALCGLASCGLAALCFSWGDGLLWIKLLFVLLFFPLLLNLLLCLCLSERFRKIMDICKTEIEIPS